MKFVTQPHPFHMRLACCCGVLFLFGLATYYRGPVVLAEAFHPNRVAEKGYWQGDQYRRSENGFGNKVTFDAVFSHYNYFNYKVFREGHGQVVMGKDDWMFLQSTTNMPPSDGGLIDFYVDVFASLHRRYQKQGQAMYLLAVPSKVSVYQEKFPYRDEAIKQRLQQYQRFVDRCKAAGIPMINWPEPDVAIADLPSEHTPKLDDRVLDELFIPQDTHWSQDGALLAAKMVVETWQERHNLTATAFPFTIRELQKQTDLPVMLAFPKTRKERFLSECQPYLVRRPAFRPDLKGPVQFRHYGTSFSNNFGLQDWIAAEGGWNYENRIANGTTIFDLAYFNFYDLTEPTVVKRNAAGEPIPVLIEFPSRLLFREVNVDTLREQLANFQAIEDRPILARISPEKIVREDKRDGKDLYRMSINTDPAFAEARYLVVRLKAKLHARSWGSCTVYFDTGQGLVRENRFEGRWARARYWQQLIVPIPENCRSLQIFPLSVHKAFEMGDILLY